MKQDLSKAHRAGERSATKKKTKDMKQLNRWLGTAAVAAVVCLGAVSASAQDDGQGQGGGPGGPGDMGPPPDGGRGGPPGMNFDPAQMQQRMLDGYKDLLEVTNTDEWAAMKPLVQKVMDARMASFAGRGPGMFGPPRRGGANAQAGPFGQQAMPEAAALQKALDAKASKAEVKAALDKYVAARQAKQNDLQQAQDSLRKLLTARQEALAALNGLL
jgi:hypothetical protein